MAGLRSSKVFPGQRLPTSRQSSGYFGEERVVKDCKCPKCKRPKTLRRLPANFKCADVICDFCGYLAQVKTCTTKNIDSIPKTIPGAAWGPQKERMDAAIYFPLFLVLVAPVHTYSIFYLSADLQRPDMFCARLPLSPQAHRAGWQGVLCKLESVRDSFVRVR
jgi:hypothetical protein